MALKVPYINKKVLLPRGNT